VKENASSSISSLGLDGVLYLLDITTGILTWWRNYHKSC
jgi:hypothetical protein